MRSEPNQSQRGWARAVWALLIALTFVSCKSESPYVARSAAKAEPTQAPSRIVAIGDIHGDLDALRQALTLAGAINAQDDWVGGSLIVVLTGDYLDRGDDDRAICDLLEALALKAREANGRLVALNGNHEIMNAMGDMRYVTPAAFETFREFAPPTELISPRVDTPAYAYGRLYAYAPGGPYAQKLAANGVVEVLGGTVFVHGALAPSVVEYGVERLNNETRAWLRGDAPEPPAMLTAQEGPIWSSAFSDEQVETSCKALQATLQALGAARMAVGHRNIPDSTGINADCDGRIWRIDVGLSKHYGGPLELLEIEGDHVRVLR